MEAKRECMGATGPPGEGCGSRCTPSPQHRSCRDREVTSSAPGKQGQAQEGQESLRLGEGGWWAGG